MAIGEYLAGVKRGPELFWKAKGQAQGDLKNACDYKGMEKYSRVYGVEWGAAGPMDHNTGQRTGKVHVGPVTIFKMIDQTSPLLMQALCNNEVITEAEFVYKDIPGGKVQGQKLTTIMTVVMKDGYITKIDAGLTPEGAMLEKVSIWYSKILWRHDVDPKTEFEDIRQDRLS